MSRKLLTNWIVCCTLALTLLTTLAWADLTDDQDHGK